MDSRSTHDYGYERRKAEFKRQYMKRKRRKRLLHNSIVMAIRLMIVVIIIIIGVKIIDYLIPSVNTGGETTISKESETGSTSVDSTTVTSDISPLLLVNKETKLDESTKPVLAEISHGIFVDTTIVEPLNSMVSTALEDGIKLTVTSGYRSESRQNEIYDTLVEKYINEGNSEEKAAVMAEQQESQSGYSDYQTGLSVDITSQEVTGGIESFATSDEYSWLISHCAEYGFILRYPEGKEELTGREYSPYHFRYVGVEAANKIMSENLTLEEYVRQNN